MSSSIQQLTYFKLIFAIGIWAGLYHVAKYVLIPGIDIKLIIFLRYFIASFCLLIILKVKTKKIIYPIGLKQGLLICLIALIGLIFYNLLFFYAESLISGNLIAIMYAFTPCITACLSAILFKLRLNILQICGIFIALIGTIGVINYSTASCGRFFCVNTFSHWDLGILYAIGATICFALYSILNKYLILNSNLIALVINTYSSLAACSILLFLFLFKGISFENIKLSTSQSFWLAMLYTSIAATAIAYLWYVEVLAKLGILKTVVFQNTLPLQTILIGYIWFNESISLNVFICSCIVVIGVLITNIPLNLIRFNTPK